MQAKAGVLLLRVTVLNLHGHSRETGWVFEDPNSAVEELELLLSLLFLSLAVFFGKAPKKLLFEGRMSTTLPFQPSGAGGRLMSSFPFSIFPRIFHAIRTSFTPRVPC